MTDEDKKLIEAAMLIKEHCKHTEVDGMCPFSKTGVCNGAARCGISAGRSVIPGVDWVIPKISRWTDADIALAKALIAFGSTRIHKNEIDNEAIYEKNGIFPCDSYVPEGAFRSLNKGETVMLKDIVAEGENYG